MGQDEDQVWLIKATSKDAIVLVDGYYSVVVVVLALWKKVEGQLSGSLPWTSSPSWRSCSSMWG